MTDSPRVVVRGEAVAEVAPDAAELVATVQVRERRRDQALTRLTERQRALRTLLAEHSAAVGEVSTDAVAVFPESPDGARFGGSVASVTTRVQLADLTAAAELAVAVAGLADTAVQGPHWRLSRDHPAHQQVRTEAVTDAIARGRACAAALGCRLTGLVEIRDTGAGAGALRAMAFATDAPQLELRPAPHEVRGSVEVTLTMSEPDQEVFAR